VQVDLLGAGKRGKEDVSLHAMHVLARALRVDLDNLVPWKQADDDAAEAVRSN
jgi:hypothetical protein